MRKITTCLIIAALIGVALPTDVDAQSADVLAYQLKRALAAEVAEIDASLGITQPTISGIVMPSGQTATRPRFGYRLILGGTYEPSAFPTETWINIACLSQDPRVAWDDDEFGSSLVYVHALIYELNADGSLDTTTRISTNDTSESDEGICDLEQGVDTSFIEIPRTFEAAVVSLFSVGRATQYIEVVENVERALAQ